MWRRSASSLARVTAAIIALWLLWSWVSGDTVLAFGPLPADGQCPWDLPCDVMRPEVRIAGRVIIPHQVLSFVAIATLLLLVSRLLNRRTRFGPLRLTEVVLSEGGDTEAAIKRATASITALIMECLQVRNVQAHGVIPSYSGIDSRATDLQGAPAYPQPANLLTRLSVALVQSSLINQGFSVSVTQTPAQLPYRFGLSFTIQRVSTGAIELVDTCWATSMEEAARKVGFRLASWRDTMRRQTRRTHQAPSPHAASMRHQYAALIEGRHRRYDGAVHVAREGLRADPGNVALRRHLGETYERLGLGLDALVVYASGLIGLDDRRNGWRHHPGNGPGQRPTPPTPAQAIIEAAAWAKPRRRPGPRRRDTDSAGLLWRYIATLGMCERWADHLIAETSRVDDLNRRREACGSHPWFSERSVEPWAGVPSSGVDLELAWSEVRERSGLVRGFLAHRYYATLMRRFPLLYACWFQERWPKEQPFQARSSPPGPTVWDLFDRARRMTPPRAHRRRGEPDPIKLEQQIHDLDQAIRALLDLHALAFGPPPGGPAQSAEVGALYAGARRCFTATLGYVSDAVGPEPTAQEQREALSAMRPGYNKELAEQKWAALRLNRHVVVTCVTRLLAQLGAVHRHVDETYHAQGDTADGGMAQGPSDTSPSPLDTALHGHGALFARVTASLDLQLALTTCAMKDLEELVAGRAETPPLGDIRLSRLLWTMAHHRYCSRLLHLERAVAFGPHGVDASTGFLATADELIRQTHERIRDITREKRVVRVPAALGRAIGRMRWWRPVMRRDDEPWSLSYYAACAYAVTIPDYPGSIDGEASPLRGGDDGEPTLTADNSYHEWCRHYDAVAKLAIHHLDAAVALRARSSRTIGSKGVADWILDEDPDLDMLRRHPRFRRWAAQQFQVTLVPDWRSSAFLSMRASRFRRSLRTTEAELAAVRAHRPWNLLFREQCCFGILGSDVPWNRSAVRWGLAHTHYLVNGLFRTVPAAIEQLNAMACRLVNRGGDATPSDTTAQFRPTLAGVAQTADDLVRFWSTVPLYRAVNSSPEMRLEIGGLLRRIGNLEHTLLPPFPREADVLLEARFLDFSVLDDLLRTRTQPGLETAATLQRLAVSGRATSAAIGQAAVLLHDCAKHLSGLLDDIEQSLGSAPSRLSLQRGWTLDPHVVVLPDAAGTSSVGLGG